MKNLKRLHGFGGLFFAVSMAFLIWEMSLDIQRQMALMQIEITVQSISVQAQLLQSSPSDSVEVIENRRVQLELLDDMLSDQLTHREELVESQSGVIPEVFLIIGAGIGAGLACARLRF